MVILYDLLNGKLKMFARLLRMRNYLQTVCCKTCLSDNQHGIMIFCAITASLFVPGQGWKQTKQIFQFE